MQTQPPARLTRLAWTGFWLLPALAVAAVYFQVHDHMFIEFDDMYYTFENPMVVRGLTWEGVLWAFTGSHVANYHPLAWLSHMLDYTLFGNNSGAFALVNALFHAMNAILVARLIALLFESRVLGVAAGIVFAVHPVLVESVAWISQRKTVLSTFFALSTALFYLKAVSGGRTRLARGPYAASLACYALSLLAKGMYVTMPAVLLLLEVIASSRRNHASLISRLLPDIATVRRIAGRLAAFVLLAMVGSVITYWAQAGDNAVQTLDELPISNRLATVFHGYLTYASHFIYPHNLSVFYPASLDWGIAMILGSGSVLIVLTLALYFIRRYDAGRAFWGWVVFLIMLLPVIGLVQVGSQALADRYMYGPIIGLLIVAASLAGIVRIHIEKPGVRQAAALGFVLWLLLTSFAGFRQTRQWHNSYSLAQSSLDAVGPEPQLLSMKAVILLRAKEYAAAQALCDQALDLAPDCFPALQNKAICQQKLGDTNGAIHTTQILVSLRPDDPTGWVNLALFLSHAGRDDEAREALSHARDHPLITPSARRLLDLVDVELARRDSAEASPP